MFRELISEAKAKFSVMRIDGSGNETIVPVMDGGKLGQAYNQRKIAVSLSNLGFAVTRAMLKKAGFDDRGGTAEMTKYIKGAAEEAWLESKGDPRKFAQAFSIKLNIRFQVV